MSYYGNLLGMFTEDEISIGLPGLVLGGDDWSDDRFYDEDDPKEKFKLDYDRDYYSIDGLVRDFNRYHSGKYIKLTTIEIDDDKKLSSLKVLKRILGNSSLISQEEEIKTITDLTKETLYKVLRKKIIMDESGQIVMRYLKKENLSMDYFSIVQKSNALKLILQDGLARILKKEALDPRSLLELEELCQRVYMNEYLDTPYTRVSEIQKFIHDKYNKAYGLKAHKSIIKDEIRGVLSVCRLHLGLHDYLFRDHYYVKQIEDKCIQEVKYELEYLRHLYFQGECKTSDFLKVVYLNPITYYMSIRQRLVLDLLDFLFKFKDQLLEDHFKYLIVRVSALKHKECFIPEKKFNYEVYD